MPQKIMYEVEIRHEGLGAYRHGRGSNYHVVRQKAEAQQRVWEERWRKQQQKVTITNKKLQAEERKADAELALAAIRNTLRSALERDPTLDWEGLKDHSPFPRQKPRPPTAEALPIEPDFANARYRASLGLLDRLVRSRRDRRLAEARKIFDDDHARWKRSCEEIRAINDERRREYESQLENWNKSNADFLEKQAISNAEVDGRRNAYLENSPAAIIDYCDAVLASSIYPDTFPKSFEIDYIAESKTLVVDYQMPALEALPTLIPTPYEAEKS